MKTKSFIISILFSFVFLSSCDDVNEIAQPSIRFLVNGSEINALKLPLEKKDTVDFFVEFRVDGKIKEIEILEISYNLDTIFSGSDTLHVDEFSGKSFWEYKYEFKRIYEPEYFDNRSVLEINFNVEDHQGNKRSSSIFITRAPRYLLEFVVIDILENPIQDARIKLGDIMNDVGDYEFLVMAETYKYEISKEGYKTKAGSVIVKDKPLIEDIILEIEGEK